MREEGFEVDEALGDEVDREGAASFSLLLDQVLGAYSGALRKRAGREAGQRL